MAIYSLRLAPIGRTTQKRPFTAAAHIRYITRKGAVSHHLAERMPEAPSKAMRWLRAQERDDRANARVADKLVIALPLELSRQQQIQLMWSFAEDLTQGRASWFAAIHANGKDRDNPHCHLLVRDRDVRNGRRVVMFSAGQKEASQRAAKGMPRPTTLRMIREMWARHANAALEQAGRPERIDHRRLVDQGVYRHAQIHEGPNIRAMHKRGVRPKSAERVRRRGALRKNGTPATRVVRYPDIDQGQTRVEYNEALKSAPGLSLVETLARSERMPRARTQTGRDREQERSC
jgi:hypothetical protein